MALVKCPNCGANIVEGGKFCAFCGTTIPDDTQHIEIEHNVNIRRERVNRAKITRIEQNAEVERERIRNEVELKRAKAELEREKRETQKHNDKVAFIAMGILFLIGFLCILPALLK